MNHDDIKNDGNPVPGTTRLVSLPVAPSNIFHFPDGLPAFEYVHEFVLLCPPDIMPFFIMQALEPKDLTFVCIDPFLVCPGYSPVISEADVKALNLVRREEVFLFSVVTVRKNMGEITANLQAPVVINIQTGIGRQILCLEKNHPVRYPLMNALSRLNEQDQTQSIPQAGKEASARILWPQNRAHRQQPVALASVKAS